ncbi:MAG: RsiV family protein, partial [Treponema sp.]|nr:RsiV family protein [Treponema sp.]
MSGTLALPSPEAAMVFVRDKEYYLGGAHSMREKECFVIDKKTGKRITAGEAVLPGEKDRFLSLVKEALRRKTDIGPEQNLTEGGFFENELEFPGNFYPSPEGFVIHWDPYEIAPYSMGPIDITLGWEETRPLLSRKGT